MKYLALEWADGSDVKLKEKFQFVFFIALKHLKRSSGSIEEIIIKQHNGLEANGVNPTEIKSILNGDHGKVLLLLDGHDEYKIGVNPDIDRAIERRNLWNSWIILTSRETEQVKNMKDYMDAEAVINGFDGKNVKAYLVKYLGSEANKVKLLAQAVLNGICKRSCCAISTVGNDGEEEISIIDYGLLAIPILLTMICVLFLYDWKLPSTKTEILKAIVNRLINREAIRNSGKKAVDRLEQVLIKLGKLAWQGLNRPDKKLLFDKASKQFVTTKFNCTLFILITEPRVADYPWFQRSLQPQIVIGFFFFSKKYWRR